MKPEDYVFKEWRKHAALAAKTHGAERQVEIAITDTLQYLLQDMSTYGHSLVWSKSHD